MRRALFTLLFNHFFFSTDDSAAFQINPVVFLARHLSVSLDPGICMVLDRWSMQGLNDSILGGRGVVRSIVDISVCMCWSILAVVFLNGMLCYT